LHKFWAEVSNGIEVWEVIAETSRKRDAPQEEGNAEERTLGKESDEPQAGHRDRTLRSARERRKGSVEEVVVEEVVVEKVFAQVLEEVIVEEVFAQVLEEEVARAQR
jgi:hypothetical protein